MGKKHSEGGKYGGKESDEVGDADLIDVGGPIQRALRSSLYPCVDGHKAECTPQATEQANHMKRNPCLQLGFSRLNKDISLSQRPNFSPFRLFEKG